jgi:hypothetical protein
MHRALLNQPTHRKVRPGRPRRPAPATPPPARKQPDELTPTIGERIGDDRDEPENLGGDLYGQCSRTRRHRPAACPTTAQPPSTGRSRGRSEG